MTGCRVQLYENINTEGILEKFLYFLGIPILSNLYQWMILPKVHSIKRMYV